MSENNKPQYYTEADFLLATSSQKKIEKNTSVILGLAKRMGSPVVIDAIDPEIFEPEIEAEDVAQVAWAKTETLKNNVHFNKESRVLIVASDVVTFIAESPESLDASQGEVLHRLVRQLSLDQEGDSGAQWEHILNTLETEKIRMIERCTNGAFSVEWHVGFALNSTDGRMANRGAVVLRATFNTLDPEIVVQAFALSEELKAIKEAGKVPTQAQLSQGIPAFAIGPRLPFTRLLKDHAVPETLTFRNRDHDDEPVVVSAEDFVNIVRDSTLSPLVAIQMLANAYSEEPQDAPFDKPTAKLALV